MERERLSPPKPEKKGGCKGRSLQSWSVTSPSWDTQKNEVQRMETFTKDTEPAKNIYCLAHLFPAPPWRLALCWVWELKTHLRACISPVPFLGGLLYKVSSTEPGTGLA